MNVSLPSDVSLVFPCLTDPKGWAYDGRGQVELDLCPVCSPSVAVGPQPPPSSSQPQPPSNQFLQKLKVPSPAH